MATYITRYAEEHGLMVVDATEPLDLEVSARDINKAVVKKHDSCGFAEACKRTLRVRAAFFFRSTAWLEYPGKMVRYMLPSSVQKEIVAFDRGKAMLPGRYRLIPPTPSNTLGSFKQRNENKPKRTGRLNGTRRVHHRTQGVRGHLTAEILGAQG